MTLPISSRHTQRARKLELRSQGKPGYLKPQFHRASERIRTPESIKIRPKCFNNAVDAIAELHERFENRLEAVDMFVGPFNF
jgi:hypothetical protein